jgi:hypothetical protein
MNFKPFACLCILLSVLAISVSLAQPKSMSSEQAHFNEAMKNGILVNEGYNRCYNYVYDWLNFTDSESGLFPENLAAGKDVWTGHNSAADNYPFMVLTSYLLDKKLYNGQMLNMLKSEKRLTSRLGTLPDTYSFSKRGFARAEVDTSQIIFGTAEYIKDGLIPLTEYIGVTPWSERMLEMLRDLSKYLKVAKKINGKFFGNSIENEINGDMLQTLSRVYWMTKDEKYLNWATDIADYYLIEHPEKILKSPRFRLRDHGCEIVGGLSELYGTLRYVNKAKKLAYQKKIYEIYDRILEVGRNEDGMFYNEVNMASGQIVDSTIVDNWGYIYDAYYTVYLIDHKDAYRQAVLKPLTILTKKYKNFDWENQGADGYADAIESGINLYNREPVPELKEWLDSEIKVLWSLQDTPLRSSAQIWKNRGIIEGWHGDGNFARTTIMYNLWKTNGLTAQPWNKKLILGTTERDGVLYVSMKSGEDWQGTIFFEDERHKKILHLPIDYPRINQFPEWYVVRDDQKYLVTKDHKTSETAGLNLRKGLKVVLKKDIPYYIKIVKAGAGR